jgi:hypothetical protein
MKHCQLKKSLDPNGYTSLETTKRKEKLREKTLQIKKNTYTYLIEKYEE